MSGGQIHRWLAEAVAHSGSVRSVYAHDTTLSRRGVLTRADRRARELRALGVGPGDLVVLALGNVVELLVLSIATSKLGAASMPVDAASGDRTLLQVCGRLPVRAIARRPRGPDEPHPPYPQRVRSSKRLSGSLVCIDSLEKPSTTAALPSGTELVLEVVGIGGVHHDVFRDGPSLRRTGESLRALQLDAATRIVCVQPLNVPRFFEPAILGWLSSESQLILGEGPGLRQTLALAGQADRVVVVDTVRELLQLGRSLQASRAELTVEAVLPQATVPTKVGTVLKKRLGTTPRQLLILEELGLLAQRSLQRNATFDPVEGVELSPGADMTVGGHELLARTDHGPTIVPAPGPDEPGTDADEHGWLHTGYAARFDKSGRVREILGRDDGLVNLEGRRVCLDNIEDVMLEHPRLTWVRALMEHAGDGDPQLRLEYRATGETPVDDLEEHAIGRLAPHMVPRAFVRKPEA